jgi:OOP family OmpA-OmpF porin
MRKRFWMGLALVLVIPGLMFAASCAKKQVECGSKWAPDVKVVKDSDGDGVPDDLDKCPNTPKGVKVDADGCPLDTDGDGVPDYLDQCPDTPKGATVNSVGCWEVVTILKKNREMKGVIEGHTDSMGSEEYNQGLSERRAQAVEKYIEEHGIDADRYTIKGYGESNPIASNDTEEGRQENRRVELRRVR